MKPQIDPRLRSIIETLRAQGFTLKGIANGFRVKLKNGHNVDIYTLRSNPSHVRARIRTSISDEAQREGQIEEIHRMLSEGTKNVAAFQSFHLTKDTEEGIFVYYAHVDMSESPHFQETIVIGDKPEEEAESFEVTDVSVEEDVSVEAETEAPEYEAPPEEEGEQLDLTDFLENGNGMPTFEEAVRQLEAVDAKTLRQALDNLSLPRSSNVRMVLTRLYRSAVDPEELEESIQTEAEKINKSNDLDELKMIKEMQSIGFLNPLLDLLWNEVGGEADNG